MNLLTINNKLLRYKNKLVMRGSSLPVLSTIENISVNNNILTFDPVENATSYEIFVDGVSIGTYEVSTGETWLLNDFNGNLTASSIDVSISFVSNQNNYNRFRCVKSDPINSGIYYDDTQIWNSTNDYISEAYRTITFDSPVTDTALLTWLQANAVKQ